jgi:hypothetical protein
MLTSDIPDIYLGFSYYVSYLLITFSVSMK